MIQLTPLLEFISKSQLLSIEKYLDLLWQDVGVDVEFTKHFLDRVNDTRNGNPITPQEVIRIFKQEYKKYGIQISKLGNNSEAILRDMKTDINVPFILKWNGHEFELVAKTIMRKKNFKTTNRKFNVV